MNTLLSTVVTFIAGVIGVLLFNSGHEQQGLFLVLLAVWARLLWGKEEKQ